MNVEPSGWRRVCVWCVMLGAGLQISVAQGKGIESAATSGENPLRIGLAGGMGVSYMGMTDVVDLANADGVLLGGHQRLPEFKAAAEFFGALTVPLASEWVLKFEYAYLLAGYNVATAYGTGQADYTAVAHLPSFILQYVLLNQSVYNVKVGAGGGYHFGTLDVKNFTQDDHYSGRGPGFLLEAEGNTAFGDHLYAYLGVNLRWDFIGTLTNAAGTGPSNASASGGTTMEFFGLGARLGFTYYF